MKLTINDSRKIHAIQEEFNTLFPYLKLEFFAKSNKSSGAHSKKMIKHPSKTLGECRAIHNSGFLSITPNMSADELEQVFRDNYDLTVQVFRKSGKAWIETTTTDRWPLERQNRVGSEMEKSVAEELASDNNPIAEER
jgi:hypothetical protein